MVIGDRWSQSRRPSSFCMTIIGTYCTGTSTYLYCTVMYYTACRLMAGEWNVLRRRVIIFMVHGTFLVRLEKARPTNNGDVS